MATSTEPRSTNGEQERPDSERWAYESGDGWADFEGVYGHFGLWADDGIECTVRIFELGEDSRVTLGIEVAAEDGSAESGTVMELEPEQAEHLAEDLREQAAYLRLQEE